MIPLLRKLWKLFDRSKRTQTFVLLALILLTSFVEVVSIATILPFLGVIFSPEKFLENDIFKFLFGYINIKSQSEMLALVTFSFIFLVALSGFFRIALLWAQARFSHAIGGEISADVYRAILNQSFSQRLNHNSSELISAVREKSNNVVGGLVSPILQIINSVITLLLIILALILINPYVALCTLFGFGFIYILVAILTKKRLEKDGATVNHLTAQSLRNIQEGLGGVRDILIDGTQSIHACVYEKTNRDLRRAVGNLQIISGIPRPLVEAIAVILIALSAYIFSTIYDANKLSDSLPIFGVIAFAAQRALPMMQQLFYSWANIQGGLASLADVIKFLEDGIGNGADATTIEHIDFGENIQLEKVSFNYPNTNHLVLRSISLTIEKGSMVGIIGSSGSGKSTLIDILMGLILPTSGSLLVDGKLVKLENIRSWQDKIAHVSQVIYLSDKSIAENIAFGVSEKDIDYERVKKVSEIAKISETIDQWPKRYATVVGERGINLSGGQRQRIGIARALYKKAQLIILDEATSALDMDTESDVMRGIESLGDNITVVIVAHRLSTLRNCDMIYKLKDGEIDCYGPPNEVLV